MPAGPYTLDVALVAIDASFVVFWALFGLAMIGGGVDLLADAFRWWRGR